MFLNSVMLGSLQKLICSVVLVQFESSLELLVSQLLSCYFAMVAYFLVWSIGLMYLLLGSWKTRFMFFCCIGNLELLFIKFSPPYTIIPWGLDIGFEICYQQSLLLLLFTKFDINDSYFLLDWLFGLWISQPVVRCPEY